MAKAGLDIGELLLKIATGETGEISKVDYVAQKPKFSTISANDEQKLKRCSPESQGVSSAFFTSLLRELAENKECKMHKFMALRNGNVICECGFEPYSIDYWHVSYSMCKSIVAMAIGILINDGKLTIVDKIDDIFSEQIGLLKFHRKTITVKNLLDMTSGSEFNEAGAISGNDWVSAFLEAGTKFEPGSQFEYNSMNTYMLSAIVTQITGKSLFEFCKERIFDPMGIKRVFWESCPKKITKGGWGLFIRTEDMAKLGQLYLNKGKWNGVQIVPEKWVEESITPQILTGREDSTHYGYQLWINGDRQDSYAFNGMLGQNVFIYPDINMVVVTNAGNSDIFQTSLMAVKIREAIKNLEIGNKPLDENFSAYSELMALCKSISGETVSYPAIVSGGWKNRAIKESVGSTRGRTAAYKSRRGDFKKSLNYFNMRNESLLAAKWLRKIDGKIYDIENNNIGVFPIMMQVVHNNFTDGIKKIGFRIDDNGFFFIDIYEGDALYALKCGFGGKRYVTNINMHGEMYQVSLESYCKTDEYNRFVLRNEIVFLEEACSRTINIYFDDDASDRADRKGTFIYPSVPSGIEVRFFETPGGEMLIDAMKNVSPEGLGGLQGIIFGKIIKGGVKGLFEDAIKNMLEPKVRGVLSQW
ncbi:serine hydrolase domain-containing protein [Butyrivibrio sp. AE2005]|uniref:serine hydrolase domain-containing protein n=2 Tax=unclassified Butyrivibrio TaxID=2639466 RepID=UPI000691C8F9|nr:serine hydrolase [Butyrivibrio sp. AE2005]